MRFVRRRVWIDSWQMHCCGEPFQVGQQVTFSTNPAVDQDFLGVVLGEPGAPGVTHYEDHHGLDTEPMANLSGTVELIEAISCRYELRDGVIYPVAGTTRAVSRDEATGWEPEQREEGLRFVGYVVTVNAEL
jgi:hypothetical protein